jgi:hypothetical protein
MYIMKLRHFHILLILLVALALCPLLGGYCGPEGLTNIDEHLRNEHGVNSGSTNNEGSNSHDHSTLTERLDNLEQTMRETSNNQGTTNTQQGTTQQGTTQQGTTQQGTTQQAPNTNGQANYNSQGAGSTALDNVGGNMRSMGALENNKIPEQNHLAEENVPPCPPCARCPESSFSCKKVPNYASKNQDHLPRPVLTNFSNFGM